MILAAFATSLVSAWLLLFGGAGPSVDIPAIGVEAPIVSVGFADNGSLEIPGLVSDVGWYEYGALPGGPGSAVLAGHVSSSTQGKGAFWDLKKLEPGDEIIYSIGTQSISFVVYEVHTVTKATISMEDIFITDEARLTLVTCGGSFSRSEGRFDSNVVVFARPVP